MIPHFYESIPGWFDFQDIYREAVERASDGAVFVEVGSWLGRSTAFMAVEIANSGKKIAFYAVDTWQGSPAAQYQDVIAQHGGSVYETFRENMRLGGVEWHVFPLIGDSALTAAAFQDRSIDLVFVDAAHDFHSVSRDVRAWLPKIEKHGLIAGHDAPCPGLMNAVKQWIPAAGLGYQGTSWLRTRYGMSGSAYAAGIGVVDESLEEWAPLDVYRRLVLAGMAENVDFGVMLKRPPTPPDRYIAKWGGPPGEEIFDFPYGVTTKDW